MRVFVLCMCVWLVCVRARACMHACGGACVRACVHAASPRSAPKFTMRAETAMPLPAPKAIGPTAPNAMALDVALPRITEHHADMVELITVCPLAPNKRMLGPVRSVPAMVPIPASAANRPH